MLTKTFFTSSEMKEFASSVFFINLLKIKSNYVSKCLLTLFDKSFNVNTAFLLNEDLKFYTSLIRSGVNCFITD